MPPDIRLSQPQLVTFLLYGVAGWFAAAMLLRFLGPTGIHQGGLRLLTYFLIIPGTAPVVWGAGKLAKAQPGQLFVGFSFSSAMAALCDGVALAWFPTLYGATVKMHAGAGAMILWGIGVGIFLAYVMDRDKSDA